MHPKRHEILVTGARSGIGRATLLAFARAGHEVRGTATTAAGAGEITRTLQDAGLKGRGVIFDATEDQAVKKLMALLAEESFSPAVLVNNAGTNRDRLLARMSEDDWRVVLEVNLSAVFHLSKACVRRMVKARWGRIINISSVVALSGNAGQCNYAASKAGMLGFTKSLAAEVARRNVTVNCVAPGFIETPMTDRMPQERRAELLRNIPMGRFGQSSEVAETVLFLASDAGAYITGETININGGLYMC